MFGIQRLPEAHELGLPATADDVERLVYELARHDCCGPRFAELLPLETRELVLRWLAEEPDFAGRFEDNWDWPDDRWLDNLVASGVAPGLISAAVKYAAVERRRCRITGVESLIASTRTGESVPSPYASLSDERA